MSVFDNSRFDNHLSVHYRYDLDSGLKSIIAIHSLGPANAAIGGARMYPYATEDDALADCLNLAKGMSLKSAMANLPYGGAKAVIIGDPKREKTPELLHAFGRFVDSLDGRYITSEDIGIDLIDLKTLRQATRYVVGAGEKVVEPAVLTSLGVFSGIRAACKDRFGSDKLAGVTVAVQGVGKVGMHLCQRLYDAGAKLIVTDVNERALEQAATDYGAKILHPDAIYEAEAQVFSPCALGGTINPETIAKLKAPIVAGSANNQLSEAADGGRLQEHGILYAPDFVINAGGLIDVAAEIDGYDYADVCQHTEAIYDTLLELFAQARREGRPTSEVAVSMAQKRAEGLGRDAA